MFLNNSSIYARLELKMISNRSLSNFQCVTNGSLKNN